MTKIKGVADMAKALLKNRKKHLLAVLAGLAAVAVIAVAAGQATVDASAKEADLLALLTKQEAEVEVEVEETYAYAITVDEAEIALLPSEEEAQAVLDAVVASYTEKVSELISVEYGQEVAVNEVIYPVRDAETGEEIAYGVPYFTSVEEATNYILTGTQEPKTYTVVSGDNMWSIARRNGIKVSEFNAMNPEYAEGILPIGVVLNLYELKPFITVATVEKVTVNESIDYDTTYEYTDTLYSGQYSVKSAGVPGTKEVVKEVRKENGVSVEETVLSETVISEPVAQVSYAGTATLQIQTGSGQLLAPLATVKVNSGFGTARSGGRKHAGVDLGGTNGQDIMASDDGTVIFSGWGEGSLGNTVKIDHGNGMVTVYAHCSKLYVNYGDNVSKGQVIAAVGKTGNATGYLVHFEVRINGTAVDPMNYL